MVNDETKRKLRELTLDGFIEALSMQGKRQIKSCIEKWQPSCL